MAHSTTNLGAPKRLNRLFRVSMAAVFAFGMLMQALLIVGVHLAERTLDRGVAPLQELLLIQRQGSQALQLVKRLDAKTLPQCSEQAQDEVCEVPLLLKNMAHSVQRLLDGEAGLAGLPPSRSLDGEARRAAIASKPWSRSHRCRTHTHRAVDIARWTCKAACWMPTTARTSLN